MGMLGINNPGFAPQRQKSEPDTLDRVFQGLELATKILGVGVDAYTGIKGVGQRDDLMKLEKAKGRADVAKFFERSPDSNQPAPDLTFQRPGAAKFTFTDEDLAQKKAQNEQLAAIETLQNKANEIKRLGDPNAWKKQVTPEAEGYDIVITASPENDLSWSNQLGRLSQAPVKEETSYEFPEFGLEGKYQLRPYVTQKELTESMRKDLDVKSRVGTPDQYVFDDERKDIITLAMANKRYGNLAEERITPIRTGAQFENFQTIAATVRNADVLEGQQKQQRFAQDVKKQELDIQQRKEISQHAVDLNNDFDSQFKDEIKLAREYKGLLKDLERGDVTSKNILVTKMRRVLGQDVGNIAVWEQRGMLPETFKSSFANMKNFLTGTETVIDPRTKEKLVGMFKDSMADLQNQIGTKFNQFELGQKLARKPLFDFGNGDKLLQNKQNYLNDLFKASEAVKAAAPKAKPVEKQGNARESAIQKLNKIRGL